MRQSELFAKTKKEPPKDATTISHKLLARADFIDQLASGIYSFLPLGWRVHRKIENIIREEMNALGGQEVFLPVLQPKSVWQETGRWDTIDPPLFKLKDRHGKELALGSTHEEVITALVRARVSSYQDLPFALYQIQDKFRNELRSQGGLLRVREFIMKDLYSFHATSEDLARFYTRVIGAYKKIYTRCGLDPVVVEASGGTIGGSITNEFMIIAESGEDKILLCKSCGWAANVEMVDAKRNDASRTLSERSESKGISKNKCPGGGKDVERASTIEAGHIFSLETKYSHAMNAWFTDHDGKRRLILMGCYGIGLGRLMSSVIEVHHDAQGMMWPGEIAPFAVHLLLIGDDRKTKDVAEKLYRDGQKAGCEILYDDRPESAGVKFADADLTGIPWRVVVSERTVAKGSVEVKKRSEKKIKLVKIKHLFKELI